MKSIKASTWALNIALLLLCLAAGGWLSVMLGQDQSADMAGYHIQNAWAFLHERWRIDIFVSGIQGYFNPLIDLPYYIIAFRWLPDYPRTVAFIMGLPYGVLTFLTFGIARQVFADASVKGPSRLIFTALATSFGVTGTALVALVGLTSNDIQTSLLVIGGVALLIYGLRDGKDHIPVAMTLLAGLLFGAAAGLKLTNCIFAPAAAVAIFSLSNPWRRKIASAGAFSLFWLLGFVVSYGLWGWHLFATTGDPLFPMLATVFHSQQAFPPGMRLSRKLYAQFMPNTLMQAIFYPFYWLRTQPSIAALPFADPRFACGMTATVFLVGAALWRPFHLTRPPMGSGSRPLLANSMIFVLIFVFVSYCIWELMFSYLRYAVSFEALIGIIVAIAILEIMRRWLPAAPVLGSIVALCVVLAVVMATTSYPNFGRSGYGERVLSVQPIILSPSSLVLVFGGSDEYLLPSIAKGNPSVEFVGAPELRLVREYSPLGARMTQKVANYDGPIYVLKRTDMNSPSTKNVREQEMNLALSRWGVSVSSSACLPFSSSIDWDLVICSAHNRKNLAWAPMPRSTVPSTPGVPVVPSSDQHVLSFMINWEASDLGENNGESRTYTLFMQQGNGAFVQIYSGMATDARVTIEQDGSYSFRVKVCAATGCSGFSGVSRAYVTFIRPSEPRDFSLTRKIIGGGNATGYVLSWNAPAVRGTQVTYKLQEAFEDGSFKTIYIGTDTAYQVLPARSGTYVYRVVACDSYATTVCGGAVTDGPINVGARAVPSDSAT